MAPLNSGQRRIADILLSVTNRPIIRKALVEAGIVESGLRNLPYGDRDSRGVLQQRPSQGWGPASDSPQTDALQFTRAAEKALAGGFKGSAAQLAQEVQRSAFPGRYAQVAGQADALTRGAGTPTYTRSSTTTTRTTPGVDNSGQRQALLLQFARQGAAGNPAAVTALAQQLPGARDTPGRTVTTTSRTPSGQPAPTGGELQLPTSFKATHQTSGLPGFPAVDVFGKPGRPVGSPISGTVTKLSGKDPSAGAYEGQGGPFGYSVYVSDGKRTYFLTHFGSRDVRVGQRVTKGQVLGTIGNYPGATPDHIHVGLNQR